MVLPCIHAVPSVYGCRGICHIPTFLLSFLMAPGIISSISLPQMAHDVVHDVWRHESLSISPTAIPPVRYPLYASWNRMLLHFPDAPHQLILAAAVRKGVIIRSNKTLLLRYSASFRYPSRICSPASPLCWWPPHKRRPSCSTILR